jgi:uncharacterized protein
MNISPLWIVLVTFVVLLVLDLLWKKKILEIPWFVAGICFVVGLTVFGLYYAQSKQANETLHVTGYASKTFESDLVKWTLSVQKNTGLDGLKDAYTSLNRDVNEFRQLLLSKGIKEKDINIQPPTSAPTYDTYSNMTGYNVNQMLYILSNDVKKVEEIALDPQFFAERSLLLQQSNLDYLYSKLPDLKKQMIGMATADAYARAKEISSSSKAHMGKLVSARAGVFQITEPYSTEVSDYGYYATTTRTKSIAVTVSADFKL